VIPACHHARPDAPAVLAVAGIGLAARRRRRRRNGWAGLAWVPSPADPASPRARP